jgi:transcriptional regulator with XRE-family HTH domain
MNAGSRIKNLRKNKNLSQTELAQLMGLTSGAMSAIEVGKNNPTAELLIKLSDFFNVSTDYLLKGVESERTITENEQEVIEIMRGDDDFKKAVTKAASFKKKAISYLGSYQQKQAHTV